jgi:Flp pilus assembly protein TadG
VRDDPWNSFFVFITQSVSLDIGQGTLRSCCLPFAPIGDVWMQLRRKSKRQKGASVVEFAIALPLLLLLLFGFIEFAAILYNQQVLTNASREGARAAISPFRPLSDAQVTGVVQQYCQNNLIAFGAAAASCAAQVSARPPGAVGTPVTVNATWTYNFLLPGIVGVGASLPLGSQTIMRTM